MGIVLSPEFSEVFDEEVPSVKNLLANISSIAIITNLASVNSMIDAGYSQQDILRIFLRRQVDEDFDPITDKLNQYHRRVHPIEWRIFTKLNISQLMMVVFEYGNTFSKDTTPEDELKIFKAYLIVIQEYHKKQQELEFNETEGNSFNNLTWTTFSDQFEFNFDPFIPFQVIKAYTLIDEMYKDETKRKYLKQFSNYVNIPLSKYIGVLTEIITTRKPFEHYGLTVPQFFILIEDDQSSILDHLSIDFEEIKNENNYKVNYYALKKYPLAKVRDGYFIVLNWTFLKAKLYEGFLFDFYYHSGINELFPIFPDFKNFIGTHVLEQRVFKAIMQCLFSKKHHVLHFDDEGKGYPDLYLRINNRIFLFEFKDTMVASKVSASSSFEAVKKEVEKKFIINDKGKPKGISQLVAHINKLKAGAFDFDKLEGGKIKKLEIYPIIVYTDSFYSMPGINKFLIEEFNKQIPESSFKHIENPVLIDILYLFRNMNFLANVRLDKLVKHYFKKLKMMEKKNRKFSDIGLWISSNMSFDMVGPTNGMKSQQDNSDCIFQKLDLKIKEWQLIT